jgi:hypothetical protein
MQPPQKRTPSLAPCKALHCSNGSSQYHQSYTECSLMYGTPFRPSGMMVVQHPLMVSNQQAASARPLML